MNLGRVARKKNVELGLYALYEKPKIQKVP